MRETVKALNTTFSTNNTPYPLPDELRSTIESFLERYDVIDNHDSQRLHEDLHALYLHHVAGNPEKHGAFLSVLRLLRPVITGETRLMMWWELVLGPIMDGTGYKRHEVEDAREFVQSILVYDRDADHDGERAHLSARFTNKLLDAYLARTTIPALPEHTVSRENEAVSHELELVLVTFGRQRPKVMTSRQHRNRILTTIGLFGRT